MKRYFDTVILGLGLFFLGFGAYLVIERNAPRDIVFASTQESPTVISPSRITISSAGIDLPVYSASIVDRQWDISKEGVSYLSSTPLPGSLGNSVYYGHNWHNLLGDLKKVKPGDLIVVKNNNGDEFIYIVHFVSVVSSNETHIYQNTSDYRLTIYTCTGLLDSKRLVVTGILQ